VILHRFVGTNPEQRREFPGNNAGRWRFFLHCQLKRRKAMANQQQNPQQGQQGQKGQDNQGGQQKPQQGGQGQGGQQKGQQDQNRPQQR
jgi:hypothetical protein